MLSEKISGKRISEIKDTLHTSWSLIKLVWGINHWLLIGTAVSIIIPAFIPFINIYIYKLVIDMVVAAVSGAQFDVTQLYPLIGYRVATYFLQDAAIRTQGFVSKLLWIKLPMVLSQMVMAKISTLDMEYFENSKFRDLLEKTRESYNARPQQLLEQIFYCLQGVIQVTIAFVAIAKLNLFLVIVVSAVAIPEFINQTQRSKFAWGLWAQNAPLRKRYNYLQHVLQSPREVKEVRIFGLARRFLDEVRGLHQKFHKENVELAKQNYLFNLIFNGLSTAVFVGVEIYVITEALARRVTVGDINFYTGVVSNFQNGLGGLFRNISGIFEHNLYVRNIFEIMDLEPIIKNPSNPIKLDVLRAPKIEFKDVDFKYPESSKYILKNFSITIDPGDKVAFVGENGAGKSTIIKLLARFYDVDKGSILVNGVDIRELNLDEWYQCLGVLFQDFNRYDHTVRENIEFGKVYDEVGLEDVVKAATLAGAHPMIQKMEKGYDQMLGRTFEEGIEPSGGQWQKIALSRAFLRSAPILVLDEPTAAIDAKAESEIFNRVERLSKDKTVIIISHRFSTVRNADKIYVIDNGKVVESGSHKELMGQSGQYATLFNLQAKGYQ